ncbi:hypothetical protein [Thiobacillus sp.]
MKVVLVLLLAGMSSVSLAAEGQPFSFKEIPLNSNIDVANSYSQVLCKELPEDKKVFGDKQCIYSRPGPYGQLDPRIATFGGASVDAIVMNYFGDTLKSIAVSVSPKNYIQIVDALREKYGKPQKEEKELLQTKSGATFENTILTWQSGPSTLMIRKYFGRIDSSVLKFEMGDYLEEVSRRRAKRSKSGASDL